MGHPTYRYHAELAPKGKIFDSDYLPEPSAGWVDSPKKFNGMTITQGPAETDSASGEFPDPTPFADVNAYIGVINGDIPVVPPDEDAAALGFTSEALEKLKSDVAGKRIRALRHYAKRVHGADLPDDISVAGGVKACRDLDKARGGGKK